MRSIVATAAFVAAIAAGLGTQDARAGVMTLTFDEFQDGESILSGYDGGLGSAGGAGPNFGATFSDGATAFGASGNFSGNPSSPNVLGFNGFGSFSMSVPAGFSGPLTFYYASESCALATTFGLPCVDASVDILDGDGNVLASLDLPDTVDSSGLLDDFAFESIGFSGIAETLEFNNVTSEFGGATTYFDNVSFVPEPGSMSLFAVALVALGMMRRRRA